MGLNGVNGDTYAVYQKKTENLVSQLLAGEKSLVIWGAGENGIRFKRYCDAVHIPVKYFCDNNRKLWGTEKLGIQIISPEELSGLENSMVLISFPGRDVVREVAAQIESGRISTYYFDDNLFYLLQNSIYDRKDTVREMISSMYRMVKEKDYLHMPILSPNLLTTRCNLKCKDCILRIPYQKAHKDEAMERIFADLDRTLEIVDSIKLLEVCGGETFLYRDLIPFLEKAKTYSRIFHICVITNGTIIPEEAVLDAMRESNISIKISDYGNISDQKTALEEICRKKDIPCFVQDCSWFDLSPKEDLHYSEAELQELFDNCNIKNNCIRNWDGIIYRCGFQRVWEGLLPELDSVHKDGVDLKDRTDDRELKKKLIEYLSASVPFEICRYCRGNTKPVPRAVQL